MALFDHKYDDHTMFVGTIDEVDKSFDHEFGKEKRVSYDVVDFHIVVWIGGIDHDVTSSIRDNHPKLYENYKQTFIEKYMDSIS
jgi:hypothetical protein